MLEVNKIFGLATHKNQSHVQIRANYVYNEVSGG